jgi:hypothetical protein
MFTIGPNKDRKEVVTSLIPADTLDSSEMEDYDTLLLSSSMESISRLVISLSFLVALLKDSNLGSTFYECTCRFTSILPYCKSVCIRDTGASAKL